MMKLSLLKLALIQSLFMVFTILNGQSGTGTSGGDSESETYKVSFSVGQCFYTATEQSNNYISSGIQHPFMLISIETDIKTDDVDPGLLAYPNPVRDWLRLRVDDPELKGLNYILLDLSGKVLQMKKIEGSESIISMTGLPSGSFILNIYGNEGIIKSFKLIKQ